MKMAAPVEISAEDAALLLGVHPRTIRNMVKRKAIRATKVSGRWFVDKTSVDALRQGSGAVGARSAAPAAASAVSPTTVVGLKGPRILAAYRLCCHAFEHFNWTLEIPEDRILRVRELQVAVLENFGAGFYSFGPEKRYRYVAARSALGGIVGLLYPHQERSEVAKILSFVETECIGATASLIRRIERERPPKKEPAP